MSLAARLCLETSNPSNSRLLRKTGCRFLGLLGNRRPPTLRTMRAFTDAREPFLTGAPTLNFLSATLGDHMMLQVPAGTSALNSGSVLPAPTSRHHPVLGTSSLRTSQPNSTCRQSSWLPKADAPTKWQQTALQVLKVYQRPPATAVHQPARQATSGRPAHARSVQLRMHRHTLLQRAPQSAEVWGHAAKRQRHHHVLPIFAA